MGVGYVRRVRISYSQRHIGVNFIIKVLQGSEIQMEITYKE